MCELVCHLSTPPRRRAYDVHTRDSHAATALVFPRMRSVLSLAAPPHHHSSHPLPTPCAQLLDLKDHSSQPCAVPLSQPIFVPLPAAVHFSQYEPFRPEEQRLILRNTDRVPRRVRVVKPDTQHFSVRGPFDGAGRPLKDSRVAPGTEVTYTVRFDPAEAADYAHDLTIVTEREKFIVPLRAVGPRAFLTLPDAVEFDSTPCRTGSTRRFMVRNEGARDAVVRL